MLPYDPETNYPSTNGTFLKVMASIGLYIDRGDVTFHQDRIELSFKRTSYGGTLSFYQHKSGKIAIGQSNVQRKTAIWWKLEPHTIQCTERPSKKKKAACPTNHWRQSCVRSIASGADVSRERLVMASSVA